MLGVGEIIFPKEGYTMESVMKTSIQIENGTYIYREMIDRKIDID